MDPTALAQEQLDAYNAHDLARFLACYAEDIRVFRMPAGEPAIVGKAAFGEFYRTQRFNQPSLRADLLGRIAFGNKVIDHERIFGLGDKPVEAAAVYEVTGGLISTVWFYYGN